ncbi:hypothetical protein [Cryobacterium sp. Hb1]|uniref:hypothetical protein n=1 Tax=Cryobacterium sp. Hb1 TaxID=1259147 RepID=UPI00141A8F09|nr:hypothetical protein [Cryobacterium sp. Hb1]
MAQPAPGLADSNSHESDARELARAEEGTQPDDHVSLRDVAIGAMNSSLIVHWPIVDG